MNIYRKLLTHYYDSVLSYSGGKEVSLFDDGDQMWLFAKIKAAELQTAPE